ncbi:MAG: hypothetical protein ABI068_08680 [Ktedonobacterales bacterium]
MRKQHFVWLSIAAIVAWVIGLILSFTSVRCTPGATTGTASCTSGPGGYIANVLYLIGIILTVIVWLAGMIRTARQGRWGWFALIFLFTPITTLIYSLVGYDQSRGAHPAHIEGGALPDPLHPVHPLMS